MYTLRKLAWDLEAYANPRKPFPCICRKLINDEVRMLIITNVNRWALYGPIDAFTTVTFYVNMKSREDYVDFFIALGTRVACGTIFGLYRMRAPKCKKTYVEPQINSLKAKKIVLYEEIEHKNYCVERMMAGYINTLKEPITPCNE